MSRVGPAAALVVLAGCIGLAACTASGTFGAWLKQAHSEGNPLVVYAFGVPGQVAIAGLGTAVPVYVQFVVTSGTPLKSVRFTLVGYGNRGRPVRLDNGKIAAIELIAPGPFDPHGNYEVNSFHADPRGFPGGAVGCVELVRMKVRYAGGAEQTYGAEALREMLLPALRRHCGDRGPPVYKMESAH